MALWFALLIPFGFTFFTWVIWSHKVTIWELFVPLLVSLALILGFKSLGESSQVADTEYWTGWVEKAEYYEHWNERVPCSHPKYKTVTKTRTVNGKTETYTEQVQDGWLHAYDVDNHPPYWQIHDNTGHTENISPSEFERLCHKFGNRQFVNLNRNFHTINGDKYVTIFPGTDDCLESCTHTHTYENRVQATSSSVFKFRSIDASEKEQYKLFDYPAVKGHTCSGVMGWSDPAAEHKLEVLNARLGKAKQVRVWVTVYRDQPLEAAFVQEAYWQGGNKNELVLAVGVDDKDNVQWGYAYSWTERERVKVESRQAITQQIGEKFDLGKLVDDVRPIIEKNWERKHFKEFHYLTVDPPLWCYISTYIITLLTNVGLAAWIVCNGADPDRPARRRTGFTGRTWE